MKASVRLLCNMNATVLTLDLLQMPVRTQCLSEWIQVYSWHIFNISSGRRNQTCDLHQPQNGLIFRCQCV